MARRKSRAPAPRPAKSRKQSRSKTKARSAKFGKRSRTKSRKRKQRKQVMKPLTAAQRSTLARQVTAARVWSAGAAAEAAVRQLIVAQDKGRSTPARPSPAGQRSGRTSAKPAAKSTASKPVRSTRRPKR